jgi:diadenosine tetraphosphate (Ap4A) HIT family hydrolase
MDDLCICETAHWKITHRRDARYAGYLMISSTHAASDLSDLDDDALSSMGPVMKTVERLLRKTYHPHKVIFYKLGFSSGFNLHFHSAPVSESLLAEISRHPDYPNEPDGNDVIMFLSREYCERSLTDVELEQQRLAVSAMRENLPAA